MTDNDIILTTFELAAEQHGDITPLVYKDFFSKHPEAEELFNIKGTQFKEELQNKMVQDAIYAFLEYLDTPEEVEIVLKYTIPQHLDLNIPMQFFVGLLTSVAAVVCNSAAPDERARAEASWASILDDFGKIVKRYSE